MTHRPLQGIKVLDFGRFIAGPFCAAILADFGADVIRVEPVEGGNDRIVTPLGEDLDGATYLPMNRNKRSLAMDLGSPESREILARLIRSADIVVANMPPRALHKLGLDYESLRALKPDIILTSVTAFGGQGPERGSIGFDGTGQAMSGALSLTGRPGQPYRAAVSYVDFSTAMTAALGTLAAVMTRRATGEGQQVEASLLRTALAIMNPILIEEASGVRTRVATENRSPIAGPSDVFATADGWIMVQVIGDDMFERWMQVVGAEDLRGDPRFKDDMARGDNGAVLSERMQAWCTGRSTADCLRLLREKRVPGCPVLSPRQALVEPQNVEGGFFHWFRQPGLDRPLPLVSPLVELSLMAPSPPRSAPVLGADTRAILREIGFSDEQVADFEQRHLVHAAEPG
ncbi:CaiB/BaiF CoA transferase family protein [Azospirillum canadense]|uniref:CaiB/BaiF CoA transferase family protein n=1 Tax=Azospirillum canadense TaxID=403962 RepID=UPI0022266FA4|nr:CoA transferase [Azospirillum canadense]MCW2241812.1 crotonobetainyl-CoA:carnitine CoA-transferase CaiB-like acyl-CoA transferase [Azospirillum canadense]